MKNNWLFFYESCYFGTVKKEFRVYIRIERFSDTTISSGSKDKGTFNELNIESIHSKTDHVRCTSTFSPTLLKKYIYTVLFYFELATVYQKNLVTKFISHCVFNLIFQTSCQQSAKLRHSSLSLCVPSPFYISPFLILFHRFIYLCIIFIIALSIMAAISFSNWIS